MLTADDHEALSQLQLLSAGVVDGITGGRHRSRHRGASVEFKEHRQYVRGDEVRSLDWKLYGKTDRLFIRQYEDESHLRAMVLLDQSGSMAYRGARSLLSKHQFAIRLAACLSTLFIAQQDAVGVATLDTGLRALVPPRSTPGHLQNIFEALVASRPGAETSLATALRQAAAQLRRRGVLILLSDCFDNVDRLLLALQSFRRSGSEVVVFPIWDPDELDFPFHGRTQFRSLEVPADQRTVDANGVRTAYLKRWEEFHERLMQGARRERIDIFACTTDQTYADILRAYLAGRRA